MFYAFSSMETRSPFTPAEQARILARMQAAQAARPQELEQMKLRQAQGLKIARKAAQVLKEKFGVQRVVLFGSLTDYKRMHEYSDIDLAVWGLSKDQLIPAGCAVDRISLINNFDQVDLVRFEAAYPYIQASIQREGIELVTYPELFQQIQLELTKMQVAVVTNERFLTVLQNTQNPSDAYDAVLAGIAMNLQGFYTGAERILASIAKTVDNIFPKGQEWHKELLGQMSVELPNYRPSVISAETLADLDELRRFRHLVRNVYSDDLEDEKVIVHANRLQVCFTNFQNDCLVFQQALSQGEL